jgi:acylphosphatase
VPEVPTAAAEWPLVSDNVRLTAWVHGRVQGVGMRWWIRSRALELGLVGWARNLDDGRVEVVAEGPEAACRDFLAQLRGVPGGSAAAPRPGRVRTVVERWSRASGAGMGDVSGFRER